MSEKRIKTEKSDLDHRDLEIASVQNRIVNYLSFGQVCTINPTVRLRPLIFFTFLTVNISESLCLS